MRRGSGGGGIGLEKGGMGGRGWGWGGWNHEECGFSTINNQSNTGPTNPAISPFPTDLKKWFHKNHQGFVTMWPYPIVSFSEKLNIYIYKDSLPRWGWTGPDLGFLFWSHPDPQKHRIRLARWIHKRTASYRRRWIPRSGRLAGAAKGAENPQTAPRGPSGLHSGARLPGLEDNLNFSFEQFSTA